MKPSPEYKYSQRNYRSLRICALPFAALFVASASAANISWNGAADAAWSTGGNWVGGVAPAATDVAVFNASSVANLTTTLDANRTILGLKITTPTGPITVAGANTLTLAGAGIDMSGATQDLVLAALIALNANQTWNVAANRTLNANNTVSGGFNLTKAGSGTLNLAGANTYTGITTIGGGTLNLTGSLNGTAGTDLTFSGTGTMHFNQAANTAQGMGVLRFSGGDGTVRSSRPGSGNTSVTFSSHAARTAGATGNFMITDGMNGDSNKIVLTGAATNALIDPGEYYSGNSYAWNDLNGYVRAINYDGTDAPLPVTGQQANLGTITGTTNLEYIGNANPLTTLAAVDSLDATLLTVADGSLFLAGQAISGAGIPANTFVSSVLGNDLTLSRFASVVTGTVVSPYASVSTQSTGSLNTLRLSGPGAAVTLDAAQTLTISGVLRSGNSSIGSVISGGAGIKAGTGRDLVIRTDLPADTLEINSPILDNGAGGLTKSGEGKLILSGANTYNGATYVNGGTLQYSTVTAPATDSLVISGASSVVSIDDDVKLLIRSTSGNQITFNTSGLIKATGTNGVFVFPTKTSAMNITVPLNEVGTISAGFLETGNAANDGHILNKLGSGKLILSGPVQLVGDVDQNLAAGITVEGGGELEVDGTLKAASTSQINGSSGRSNPDSKVGASSGNNTLRITGALGTTALIGGLWVGEDPTGNNQVIISRPGNGSIFGQASFLIWGGGKQLRLGVASSNNSLIVSNGAVVASGGGGGANTWFIGLNAGANNNTFLVTGGGSTVTFGANQAIIVGAAGDGNSLTISAGGTFRAKKFQIGQNGGKNNFAIIDGAGSNFTINDTTANAFVEVGSVSGSNGNNVTVQNAGSFNVTSNSGTNRNFSVGKAAGASNNFLKITGVGSSLNVNYILPIGVGGQATVTSFTDAGVTSLGNHLDIFSGGNATTNTSIYLGGGTTGAGNQTALNLGDGNGLSVLSVGASTGFTSGIFFSGTAGTQQQFNINGGKLIATVNGTLVSGTTGTIILNGPATISQSGTSTQSNTITASITGGVGGSFTKEGAGVLVLNAANTYAGQTIASQGILEFQNTAALYNADASKWTKANITVNSGGTLGFAVGGAGQFVANDIATFLDVTHLGASDASTGLLSGGSIGFDTAGGNFSTSIVISNPNNGANALGVVKFGANTLTLTGVNSYTGPTKISAGTLSVGADANLGGTNSLILDGGTLQITGNTLNNLSQHTPVAVAAKTVTIDIADASNIFTVSQALNQTTGGLIKLGPGTLVLGDANTFTGATTISNGVLSINSIQNAGSSTANALGNPAVGAGSIIGLAASGTLQFTGSANGASDRVISLSTPAGGTFTLDASGSETFALSGGITSAGTSGTSTLILTGSGNGSESGIIANGTGANTTAVTKNGSGTWTLGGGNTYSGDTSVNGGTLVVGGFIVGSTAVNAGTLVVNGTISGSTSVSSGGTLAGSNGTLGNVTVESSGTFSPGGNGTGSLRVNGDLELKASSNFNVQFDTDGGFVDAISVNGNLTIVTGAVFNVSDIGSAPDGFLNFPNDIITYSGTWNGGTFLGLQDDSIFTSEGITYLISYNDNDINGLGLHAVTLTIVPEPGAAVTLLGGLGILLGVRRRRACSNLHGKPRVL